MTPGTGRDDGRADLRGDDDDEALSWGPSSDKSYVEGPASGVATGPDSGLSDDHADDDDDDGLPEGVMSSGALVAHGVFAAILLLYTVAWLRSIGDVQPSFDNAIASFMWTIGTWFAVAAPALWFVGTMWLIGTTRMRSRLLSLLAAVIVLFPWPLVIGPK